MLEDIREFNEKFQIPMLPAPGFLSDEDMKRRLDFQLEELLETAHAAGFKMLLTGRFEKDPTYFKNPPSLPDILDGLVDQIYVAMGTAAMMGFFNGKLGYKAPCHQYKIKDGKTEYMGTTDGTFTSPIFNIAWQRVHKANMKKQKVEGTWKIQKPGDWQRPNLEDLCK